MPLTQTAYNDMLDELLRVKRVNAELLTAAKLTSLCFKRALAGGAFLGDDEHEAWTALDHAIQRAEAQCPSPL